MEINNRVINLMCLMAEHGFVTVKEIEKYELPERSRLRYFDLLNELKFMDSFDTHLRLARAYYLTDAGYKYLVSVNKLRVMKRFVQSDYRLTMFFHTVLGLQVRLIFQKHPWVVDYRPEKVVAYYHELHSGKDEIKSKAKQCDAEMIIKAPKSEYKTGVEIELTSKSFKRLTGAIKSIDVNRDDLNVVLWIASSEVIIRDLQHAIQTLLPQLRNPNKHLFALWNDLNSKQLNTVWCDAEGHKTKLFD